MKAVLTCHLSSHLLMFIVEVNLTTKQESFGYKNFHGLIFGDSLMATKFYLLTKAVLSNLLTKAGFPCNHKIYKTFNP